MHAQHRQTICILRKWIYSRHDNYARWFVYCFTLPTLTDTHSLTFVEVDDAIWMIWIWLPCERFAAALKTSPNSHISHFVLNCEATFVEFENTSIAGRRLTKQDAPWYRRSTLIYVVQCLSSVVRLRCDHLFFKLHTSAVLPLNGVHVQYITYHI